MADIQKDLYNKLWDNINLKDNRVWTFLSFYGAAIALVLGAKAPSGYALVAILFLVVFSFWAEMFAISSEWWGARNRLMILTIEDDSTGVNTNIPTFYREPRFTSDEILATSIWIIFGMQVVFSLMFLYYISDQNLVTTLSSKLVRNRPHLLHLVSAHSSWIFDLAQLVLIWLIAYPLKIREGRLAEFWGLVQNFREQRQNHEISANHFKFDDSHFIKLRSDNILQYRKRWPLFCSIVVILSFDVTDDMLGYFALFVTVLFVLIHSSVRVLKVELDNSTVKTRIANSFMSIVLDRGGASDYCNLMIVALVSLGAFYF